MVLPCGLETGVISIGGKNGGKSDHADEGLAREGTGRVAAALAARYASKASHVGAWNYRVAGERDTETQKAAQLSMGHQARGDGGDVVGDIYSDASMLDGPGVLGRVGWVSAWLCLELRLP